MIAGAASLGNETVTRDAFLGGRVETLQPAAGHHRSGLEAVLIAAGLPRDFAGAVVDLGAGSGAAGLCAVAMRVGASAILVEREPELAARARDALALPANRAFAARVQVAEIDIGAAEKKRIAAGLPRGHADAVIMNPPFYAAGRSRPAAAPGLAAAHMLGDEGLDLWFRAAAWAVKPGGMLIAIGRAADMSDMIAAAANRFGSIDLLPIHPRAGKPAQRLLLRAIIGARGETRILAGLDLHQATGHAFTAPVEKVLRDGAALEETCPQWRLRDQNA